MFTKNWWWWGGGVMPAKFPGPPTNPVSGPTDLWDTSNGITLGQKNWYHFTPDPHAPLHFASPCSSKTWELVYIFLFISCVKFCT